MNFFGGRVRCLLLPIAVSPIPRCKAHACLPPAPRRTALFTPRIPSAGRRLRRRPRLRRRGPPTLWRRRVHGAGAPPGGRLLLRGRPQRTGAQRTQYRHVPSHTLSCAALRPPRISRDASLLNISYASDGLMSVSFCPTRKPAVAYPLRGRGPLGRPARAAAALLRPRGAGTPRISPPTASR